MIIHQIEKEKLRLEKAFADKITNEQVGLLTILHALSDSTKKQAFICLLTCTYCRHMGKLASQIRYILDPYSIPYFSLPVSLLIFSTCFVFQHGTYSLPDG